MTAMPVEVQIVSRSALPAGADLARWAQSVLDWAPTPDGKPAGDGEICVRVVDEKESRTLNLRYRNKDRSTNVLSFPADLDLPEGRVWGDIVVCAPVVAAEAAEQGKTPDAHFAHMIVHGVLHLLGYDHQSGADADTMESLEREILGRFGIGDPYLIS